MTSVDSGSMLTKAVGLSVAGLIQALLIALVMADSRLEVATHL